MVSRLRRLTVVLFAAVLVSRAVACGDDSNDSDPARHDAGDASSSPAADAPAPVDEVADGSTPPAPPPSYCAGIVFYAAFDNGVTPELGGGVVRHVGGVGVASGRFGAGALAMPQDSGPDGAMVFYDRGDGGSPIVYPEREGSLAFWYRGAHGAGRTGVLYRPLGSTGAALVPGGLVLAHDRTLFGLFEDLGGAPVLTFPETAIASFLRPGDYNHYTTAWRGPDDAGQGQIAILVLNGGRGETLPSGGVDAAAYADASPDRDILIPYRAQTVRPWRVRQFATLRLGGFPATVPGGDLDDLAIWNRVLSYAEIEELYKSTESIGARCKLP